MLGRETLETGPAYVLSVVPKTQNKYLIDGKIWVDANDYSIIQRERDDTPDQPQQIYLFVGKWIHQIADDSEHTQSTMRSY